MSDETAAYARPDSTSAEPHPARWRILSVTLVVGFMSLLDVSIVNVAIPSMQKGLETSSGTIQWVVSGYALAFGLTLVAGGRLGDAYGRRTLMLIGLAGFIVSSAAVGLAPDAGLVIVARLVQGATAGLLTPQNTGLIQQLFSGAERARAFGLFGFTVSVSSAAGPVIGGLIIAAAGEESGWRWLFLINVPIGLAAMLGVAKLVPKRPKSAVAQGGKQIDVIGAGLLGLTVLALLVPVVQLEAGKRWPLVALVLVPAFAWLFFRWEARLSATGRPPLLDIQVLRGIPGYVNGLAVGALYFTGFTGLLLVFSVYLQTSQGFTPLQSGLLVMPFAVGSSIAAPLAGRLVPTIGRPLTVGAISLVMVGMAALALLAPGRAPDSLWVVAVPTLFVAGLGGGAVVSPNITLTLDSVPVSMAGAAGGALQTGQRIGASIGAALLMTAYQLALASVAPGQALRISLVLAIVLLTVALVMAIQAMRAARGRSPLAT